MKVLVTGGAGFIGSHTCDALVELGMEVTVLDTIEPDVHGPTRHPPAYLNPGVALVQGDIRDQAITRSLVDRSDIVFHFAACTGVGQSMYELHRYSDVNVVGTAVLLEAIAQRSRPLGRLVVASSRAVYGEGAYRCKNCGPVTPRPRSLGQLQTAAWEPVCPTCGGSATAIETNEAVAPCPGSIYGVTKLAQEQACLIAGAAHGIPVVALRYFNVFGPRQSLRNPYTGVITTFLSCVRAGRAPEVYEDGLESRDFVHVSDVVRANILAIERDEPVGRVINVASGVPVSLLDVAGVVSEALDGRPPVVNGKFRVGDVRHCFADLRLAREHLGYEPQGDFRSGVRRLVDEIGHVQVEDLSAVAEAELRIRGLSSEART